MGTGGREFESLISDQSLKELRVLVGPEAACKVGFLPEGIIRRGQEFSDGRQDLPLSDDVHIYLNRYVSELSLRFSVSLGLDKVFTDLNKKQKV